MNPTKAIGVALVALLIPHVAIAAGLQGLEPSEYPAEVATALADVRNGCREAGQLPSEDPQAGVTIIDLDRDGSKDILLDAWHACDVPVKGGGACNTAGCIIQIFKQVAPHRWKMVFDETLLTDWFLSVSDEGHFRLMALSVSRKISDRCPDPSGGTCDYLLYWKHKRWIWDRIR
jgi:hypothetical protein